VNHGKIVTTQIIEDVVNRSVADRIPIKDLITSMESTGFGLVMMIFSLAGIIPLPPPFPSLISIPTVLFSLQMMLGYKSPKLPQRFARLTVKRSVLAMLVQKSSPYIRKIEAILRPRLIFMTSKKVERIVGVFFFLFSSFILLPIPLSNFIPAIGIFIASFGLLGRDGLVTILGILVGIFGVFFSTATLFLGVEMIHHLLEML
jgi:hypothetical protein